MSTNFWSPYTPDARSPWNLLRVVHLHRRAGFAPNWGELQRDLREGPQKSIERLLVGKSRMGGVPDNFEATATLLRDSAVTSGDPARLKAWWIYRMLFGPDALTERLVLMWHNHFATSNLKVEDLDAMREQNDCFRKLARASFGELLPAVVKGKAMLVWLDAAANRKGHPNENLGRELMELFALGIGNYTERDVKDAARALTGWSLVEEGGFVERPAQHDAGEKTILGKTGPWKGDDLVRIVLESPATAKRLAYRLTQQFMGTGFANRAACEELAAGLRQRKLDVGWGVETILRSQAFFADDNLRQRILCPVDYVVGAVRALEAIDPPPSTLVLAEWLTRLGQDLFYPPNVGGWAGGRALLDARTIVNRANFAAALVRGHGVGRSMPLPVRELAQRYGAGRTTEELLGFFTRLLFGQEPDEKLRGRINGALGTGSKVDDQNLQRLLTMLLSSPEAQVG
ncbi:hypothetical protein BH10PLA2_BH10PLA2_05300 [soil metagenome]